MSMRKYLIKAKIISLRWVIKEKLVDNEKFIKARLCARGFEEEQNYRTDSQRALEKAFA